MTSRDTSPTRAEQPPDLILPTPEDFDDWDSDCLPTPENHHDWFYDCPFHREGHTLRAPPSSGRCRITGLGSKIHFSDEWAIRTFLRQGASPNSPCHKGIFGDNVYFPLGLATSPCYYHRSFADACFLALVEAGADPKLQAETEEELRNLKDSIMVFAIRPSASIKVLEVALDLGITDTESGRERLVDAVTKRPWYHGIDSDGTEVWAPQDDFLQAERQRIIREKVPLSEDQKAQFWCDNWSHLEPEEYPLPKYLVGPFDYLLLN